MKSKSNDLNSEAVYSQILHNCKLCILLGLLILLLSACSPHPAAHTWVTDDQNEPGISKLDVTFEGTAEFYSTADLKSIRRCFWGAKSRTIIELNCVHAEDTEIKETYELEVADNNSARLTHNKILIARLSKQTIRDQELKEMEKEKNKKEH
mgnify:FL=1